MPNIQVVSTERHQDKQWSRLNGFSFTANDVLCRLVAQEFPHIVMSLPTGFTKTDEGYVPVAVLGLIPGQNLIVDSGGRWRGPYVPVAYRCYPFSLIEHDDKRVLCVDEEAAQVETASDGEPFFNGDGEITDTIANLLDFLNQHQDQIQHSFSITKQLDELDLLEPWPLKVSIDDNVKEVAGLYRVNEAALNKLASEALADLRNSGALLVAYCQLLSMTHLPKLVQLAQSAAPEPAKEIDFGSMTDMGSLDFSKL